jgi:ADP-heptose:LPS heptosyltransferase
LGKGFALKSMTIKALSVENIKKIAILRANALGDFIVTLPAIHAIRATYPDAELVLLGKPWHQEFLANNRTSIDRVIVVPVTKGIREEKDMQPDERELEQFFKDIQKEQFDIAVQFQGKGVAANPFVNKLGAKFTVGLTCPEAEALDRAIDFYYYQSEVVRYIEVAQLIGAKAFSLEPEIAVLPKDIEEANAFLKERAVDRPYVVLHPCGMDCRRNWPSEKFAEVADILATRGYQVIFTGSAADKEVIDSIIQRTNKGAVNACGELSLAGLAGFLAQSEVVVSSDTGPLHLARAVGAKTVGIYWAPNLINWGPLSRRNHKPLVSWKLQCPSCGIVPNNPYPFEPQVNDCQHLVSFVSDITTDEVIKQVDSLLSSSEITLKFDNNSSLKPSENLA